MTDKKPEQPKRPYMIPAQKPQPLQPQVVINAQNCQFNIWQAKEEEREDNEPEQLGI